MTQWIQEKSFSPSRKDVCWADGSPCALCVLWLCVSAVSGVPDPDLTHAAVMYRSLTLPWCVCILKCSCLMFDSFMLCRDGNLLLKITLLRFRDTEPWRIFVQGYFL